jgi:hypothetical protein
MTQDSGRREILLSQKERAFNRTGELSRAVESLRAAVDTIRLSSEQVAYQHTGNQPSAVHAYGIEPQPKPADSISGNDAVSSVSTTVKNADHYQDGEITVSATASQFKSSPAPSVDADPLVTTASTTLPPGDDDTITLEGARQAVDAARGGTEEYQLAA